MVDGDGVSDLQEADELERVEPVGAGLLVVDLRPVLWARASPGGGMTRPGRICLTPGWHLNGDPDQERQ